MKIKNQIKIFIVEDNKLFALALKADIENAIQNMPVKIFLFETGEKCMDTIKIEKPQIIILDYHLDTSNPDAANGITILDRIMKENREINVIMLTREDNVDIAIKSFKHGASDFIVKTDTQFRKIIFSLFNLIRMLNAKKEALRYKRIAIGLCLTIAMWIGIVVALQIFDVSILIP